MDIQYRGETITCEEKPDCNVYHWRGMSFYYIALMRALIDYHIRDGSIQKKEF